MSSEDLGAFLRKHYGTLENCADQLGVDRRTVYRWCSHNPSGLLKHMPTMVNQCNTTPTQIMGEVMFQEEILYPTGL